MTKLRLAECRPFFDAVVEKSTEMGVGVCSAVVNAEGHVIALERTDLGGFILPDFAIAKAFTVCAFRAVSPRFPDGVVIQKWFQERNPQLLVNASVLTGGKIYVSGGCAPTIRASSAFSLLCRCRTSRAASARSSSPSTHCTQTGSI